MTKSEIIYGDSYHQISVYLKGIKTGKIRHKYYDETVREAKTMAVHVEGVKPTDLLQAKRPNEPEAVTSYRLSIYKPVTKSYTEKIINTVARIFNSRLFNIQFPEKPNLIDDDFEIENYITNHFGKYRSIWLFIRETLLKLLFSDPNAVCVIAPEYIPEEVNEHLSPVPFIHRCNEVVDFDDEDFFTFLHSKSGVTLITIVDKLRIRRWAVKGDLFELEYEFVHGLGKCPAFRLGGQIQGESYPYYYTSYISGVAPHWDRVIEMVSDLDGSIVNHLFPEKYEWEDTCRPCGGKGKIYTTEDKDEKRARKCTTCKGSGISVNRSPYGIIGIKRDTMTPEAPLPTPPAGYITKDIAPIQELKKMIDDQIYQGYCAINMEVLSLVGANQSGVSKAIDRQDVESFYNRLATHVFDYDIKNILDLSARWIMQYSIGESAVNEYVKNISVSKPKEWNVFTTGMLVNELAGAEKVSGSYYRQLELEIVNNKFSNNDFQRRKNTAIINLKPFPSKTIDQLLSANAVGAIRKIDMIRNENIDELVSLAIEADDTFLDMPMSEQIPVIEKIINERYIQALVQTIPVQ